VASTELDIINGGLALAGAASITTLDSAEPVVANIKRVWESVKDEVLSEHDWGCARAREELTEMTNESSDWTYKYQLPADPYCIVPRKFDGNPDAGFELAGRTLYCDIGSAVLIFTKRITNPLEYSPHVERCITFKLAEILCIQITKNTELSNFLNGKYTKQLRQAKNTESKVGRKHVRNLSQYEVEEKWGE
jgi:hypothetical protein